MSDKHSKSHPFHEVGSLFPGDVTPVCVGPDTPIPEALRVMLEQRYSQLPVMEENKVRGVFSLWSLAQHLEDAPHLALSEMVVEDCMEQLPTVTVEDDLGSVIQILKQREAVLVGAPHALQAVATPMDVLDYFYGIAKPFILLMEIELSLRELITSCTPAGELQVCIGQSLRDKYGRLNRKLPSSLTEMSLEDYRLIITSRKNWQYFKGVLGKNRDLVSVRLEKVRRIRNQVVHFRGKLSVLDHQNLVAMRFWLLDKVRRLADIRKE